MWFLWIWDYTSRKINVANTPVVAPFEHLSNNAVLNTSYTIDLVFPQNKIIWPGYLWDYVLEINRHAFLHVVAYNT